MLSNEDLQLVIPKFKEWAKQKKLVDLWLVDGYYYRYPTVIILEVGSTLFSFEIAKGSDKGRQFTYALSALKRFRLHDPVRGRYAVPEDEDDSSNR